MLTKPEEIKNILESMEKEIKANAEYIDLLFCFKKASAEYDGKVLNKRFTDVLKKHLPANFITYDLRELPQSIQFTVYQKERTSENYSKSYNFPIESCFTRTESGKLRVKASGFSERCVEIRNELIQQNIKIRADIDNVYPMLAEADALYKQAQAFESKYNYSLKAKFKCNYYLRNSY